MIKETSIRCFHPLEAVPAFCAATPHGSEGQAPRGMAPAREIPGATMRSSEW